MDNIGKFYKFVPCINGGLNREGGLFAIFGLEGRGLLERGLDREGGLMELLL